MRQHTVTRITRQEVIAVYCLGVFSFLFFFPLIAELHGSEFGLLVCIVPRIFMPKCTPKANVITQ